jgi:hypothetical protein
MTARLSFAAAALFLTNTAALSTSLEYAVKAAYLYKFAPFVEWPATTFSSADSPINICVSGKDPFGSALDQAVAGQHVEGHALVVRRIADIAAASGCQIVYLGASAGQSASLGLDALRGQPVLTVSDSVSDPASRGIINLLVEDNKVRFEIDDRAAEQSHLTISSKLLSLAYRKTK